MPSKASRSRISAPRNPISARSRRHLPTGDGLLPAGIRAEVFVEFIGNLLELIGIRRIGLLARDIGPRRRVLAVEIKPALGGRLAIGNDRFDRAFRLAHSAVDAL